MRRARFLRWTPGRGVASVPLLALSLALTALAASPPAGSGPSQAGGPPPELLWKFRTGG